MDMTDSQRLNPPVRTDAEWLAAHWMPYTGNRQFKADPRLIVAAQGAYFTSHDGRQIFDGLSGLWTTGLGHCRAEIAQAVARQVATLDYSPAFQFGHPLSFQLANQIVERMPAAGVDHADAAQPQDDATLAFIDGVGGGEQQHQRGVAGHELKVVGIDPGTADSEFPRQRGEQDNLAITGCSKACGNDKRDPETGTGQCKQIALAQQRLLALMGNVGKHECLPSTGKQAAVGRRRRFQAQQSGRQIPIGGMGYPGAGASCFCLSQREPGAERNNDADKDMLAEDPPGEGDNHPGKLVDCPKANKLWIVEPPGNDVGICHENAAFPCPMRQMIAVTTEVTIGTPVPTPMPIASGRARAARCRAPGATGKAGSKPPAGACNSLASRRC